MTIAEKLTNIADRIPIVYYEGRQSHWNEFWDDFQEKGTRTAYNNAFQNAWSDVAFRPKYDIRPTSAGYMFAGTKIADIKGCLESCGVELDLSKATSIDRLFSDAPNLTHLPKISTVSAPHLQNFVYNCKKLISIEEIVLKSDGTQTFNDNSFKSCENLLEIRFSGVIGSSLNVQWSKKLSAESYNSIFTALSNKSTGGKLTVASEAVDIFDAFYGANSWAMMVGARTNWSFTYA